MMNRRAAVVLCILLLLFAGCDGQSGGDIVNPMPTDGGDALRPIVNTPVPTPTPEPELTTLDMAFSRAKEVVRDLPVADPLEVFPFSSNRLLSSAELRAATPRDLEWAWREIAARRGIKEYRAYDFTDREWYEYDPEFQKSELSQIEASNIIFLRNSAIEHYTNMKIVKNNRAQADLDGDGKRESFSFSADRYSDSGILQIGSIRYTIELPQIDNRVYLCDIDRRDDRLELAIPFTRAGTDYRLAFFAYDGENLAMLGEIQGDRETVRIHNDGTLQAYALESELCAWRYPLTYELVGDALVPKPLGIRSMKIRTALKTSLTLADPSGKRLTLEAGASVILISSTPQGEYVLYEPANNRYGVFMLTDGLIDGVKPEEVFSDLPAFA